MVAVHHDERREYRALLPAREQRCFSVLVAVTVLAFALLLAVPGVVPSAAIVLLVVSAALTLGPGRFAIYSLIVVVGVALTGAAHGDRSEDVRASLAVIVATIPLLALFLRRRFALGMAGSRPEHLLIEMHERLADSTRLPRLPSAWGAQTCTQPASGAPFGGDFVVSARTGSLLQITMVDVSGNGLTAAARATQLTGALGALIGSVPPEQFLEQANDYVWRQGWSEGFATVVHLSLDLDTGEYAIARAGHPAPLVREAGTERWFLLEGASSVPLGVSAQAAFPRRLGILAPGDGMVLYSDGVIESRTQPGLQGTVRLQRAAAREVSEHGFADTAARIASAAPSSDEDRTVVVVWRNPA